MAMRRGRCPVSVWRSTWWAMPSPRSIAVEMLGVAGRFGQTMRFMMTFTYLGREGAKPRVLGVGCARACDGRHGRGRRPHHAFGG